jgi:hypothetical protein
MLSYSGDRCLYQKSILCKGQVAKQPMNASKGTNCRHSCFPTTHLSANGRSLRGTRAVVRRGRSCKPVHEKNRSCSQRRVSEARCSFELAAARLGCRHTTATQAESSYTVISGPSCRGRLNSASGAADRLSIPLEMVANSHMFPP